MTNAEIQERLRSCSLLQDFTDAEIATFVDLLEPVRVASGECVVRQDQPGDAMYILVAGTARVTHHRDSREVTLAQMKPGDFFGELSLVDRGPRSADVEATSDCVLLKIPAGVLPALAGVYPQAAFKFLLSLGRLLVGRLRHSNQRYVDSLLFPD